MRAKAQLGQGMSGTRHKRARHERDNATEGHDRGIRVSAQEERWSRHERVKA